MVRKAASLCFLDSVSGICSELRLTAPVLSPDWNLREAEGPGPSWLFTAHEAEVCQEVETLAPTCQGWLTNIYNMFAAGTNATRWCGSPSM